MIFVSPQYSTTQIPLSSRLACMVGQKQICQNTREPVQKIPHTELFAENFDERITELISHFDALFYLNN